jgi:hypothetical protein
VELNISCSYLENQIVIGIEKEGIVTVFEEYSVCKPSMGGQVYSIRVRIFCDVVNLSTSLIQLIADASLIITKLINLTVKNVLHYIPLNIQHTEQDMQCIHNVTWRIA